MMDGTKGLVKVGCCPRYVSTQWATKVKIFVAFSLKPTCFGDRVLPPFDGHT